MEIEINCKKFLIDEEDMWLFDYCKWNCNNKAGYLRNQWKINDLYHRYILIDKIKELSKIMNIPENKITVDHINQNKRDNRKSNLRLVSFSDNMINRPLQRNNTSGYKGILITKCGNYRVNLTYKGIKYRPTFKNLNDAIEYRENKIKELGLFEYKNKKV